jgi:pimeloyl-ACP methyl ester carboxylesterase
MKEEAAGEMDVGKLPRRSYVGLSLVEERAGPEPAVRVRAVRPGSPAEEAGARPGDRVVTVDGASAAGVADVRRRLGALKPGAAFSLGVVRDGVELPLPARARALPVETFAGASVRLAEVSPGGAGGHRLRAIAVIPDGDGPHPVVYYLPGAHWASEEHPFDPDHPVRALLAALAARGFASLRVERSGVGDSEGPPCTEVDFETELAGYRAGLDLLTRAPWAAQASIFLYGHSLGGIVAPLVAADASAPLRGVAVFGTLIEPFDQSLIGTARRRTELLGTPGAERDVFLEGVMEIVRAVVRDGATPAELYARRPDLAGVVPEFYSGDKMFGRVVRFYQQIARLDLPAIWSRVRAPVLALHGDGDWVVPAADARAIAAGGGRFAALPGVDHFMRAAASGGGALGLADALVSTLADWLGERLSS